MTAEGFEIRLATEREQPDVLALLAEYLPDEDPARRHAWLYVQNPHGRAVTMVAYERRTGTPAGLTSVFPRRVLVSGQERLGSMGGDGYVRPAFRRRGLATALHEASVRAMKERGVSMMFGPPEPNNLKALLRAGSRVVTHVTRYARPGPVHRALGLASSLRRRLRPRRGARLEPISGVDRRLARIWERVASEPLTLPVRDPEHYAWRFGDTPAGAQCAFLLTRGGEPLAACALERAGRGVAVVDLVAPSAIFAEVLADVADLAGGDRISIQLNAAGLASAELWRAGFFPRETKPFQVLLADASSSDPAYDPMGWFYTWGDGDLDRVL